MKSFAIVPTQQELDSLEREFGFHPADPQAARTLAREHVESFNRNGYLSGLDIYRSPETTAIRDYFDELLRRTLAEGGDSYSISSAHLRYGFVYDILTEPRIVSLVVDLLGEDVVGWGSHFFCKMPGDGKVVDWHQDASYWPLTPTKTVTVWLAVDRADTENACMQFIAGSHTQGQIAYRASAEDEGNVLNQTIEDPLRFGPVKDVVLEAGQVSIHSDLLLHGSQANHSNRRRCGLTLRYCSADVRAHLDWNQKGVVVHGQDKDRHWANPPRPE